MAAKRKTNRRKTNRRRKSAAKKNWGWLLAGLLIGILIASLVYLYLTRNAAPSTMPQQSTPAKEAVTKTEPPAPEAPIKSAYEFYTLLEEMEVVIPEQEQLPPREEGTPATYMLQVGSFRDFSDADSLQAKLALLGIESKIQKVTVDNTVTWHRVRVGPFTSWRELNRVRSKLRRNDYEAIALKIGDK